MPTRTDNIIQLPRKLPKQLRSLFWDCRFSRLNGERDGDFVAYRILESGDWENLKWLCRTAGDEPLKELVAKRQGAGLSREQLRFWEAMWKLPKRTVDAWLNRKEREIWDRRAG